MKGSRFKEEQIIAILREQEPQEAQTPVPGRTPAGAPAWRA